MTNKQTVEDIEGVKCPTCEGETFRVFKREVEVIPGMILPFECCPKCAARIDEWQETAKSENEKKKSLDGLTKAQRRIKFLEQSHEWARNLDGKRVIVYWNTYNVYRDVTGKNSLSGTAYIAPDTCGGWAEMKVVLDPSENKRVKMVCNRSTGQRCLTIDKDITRDFICDSSCKERIALIDVGLPCRCSKICFPTDDGNWLIYVGWGERNSIVQIKDELF